MADSRAADVALWFALVFPSTFVVDKYLGGEGTIVYAVVVGLVVACQPQSTERRSNDHLWWLALLTWFVIVVAFFVVYPIVNTHAPASGSDDDDALNLGATALLSWRSPYTQTTYLGNALHQLPGAFVLASPFVLVGTSALQNLVWLPLFFLTVREEANSQRALRWAWFVLALSPEVMYEVVTGTGYVSNTISVLLGLWWLIRTKHRDLAAIAWGLTLASRANFLFLVPLLFAYLRQHAGPRTALRATALTCATTACLSVPFYLHDRRHFGPLEAADRLLVFNQLLPHLALAILVLMAMLAITLSFTQMSAAALFRNCALVQAVPVLAGVVLISIQDGRLDLRYARYGPFFAWFVLMALAFESPGSRASQRRAGGESPWMESVRA